MGGGVGRLKASYAALDQPRLDDVFLSQVVILLQKHPIRHALEEILAEHRLRLSLSPGGDLLALRVGALLRQEVLLRELHVIDKHNAQLVFLRHLQ